MASTSPTNTYGTYLMVKNLTYSNSTWSASSGGTSTYQKLVDIKDYPNLGGDPELLETTTLSDKMQTNILGIQSSDLLQFTANYVLSDFKKLKALEDYIALNGDADFEIWFSQSALSTPASPTTDAVDGEFAFKGKISSYPIGKGVNEVKEIQVSIANSTVITQLQ